MRFACQEDEHVSIRALGGVQNGKWVEAEAVGGFPRVYVYISRGGRVVRPLSSGRVWRGEGVRVSLRSHTRFSSVDLAISGYPRASHTCSRQ